MTKVFRRFRVVPAGIDEERLRTSDPAAFTLRAAGAKARAVGKKHPDSLIIAADTLVSLGPRIFGKPNTRKEARSMLSELSGRRHRVVTGVVFYRSRPRRTLSGCETSWVTFKELTRDDIEQYLDLIEHLDKAGAYAIQESGDRLVRRLEGDYDNVVGFPTSLVRQLMKRWKEAEGL
jgi:septum formation protein